MLVEAENVAFEQRVAIRIVSRAASNEVEVAKFRRESQALAKLTSEHVARIIDVGMLPDGSFYLVRQFLEGTDLASYLRERRTLPVDEAVGLILQATEAIAETHAHGIIVRELAPEHLFLAERSPGIRGKRILKMIDFGTSKLLADGGGGQMEDEATAMAALGTSPYSSPEMLCQQKLDARTDIWSLGAILYEMLAGKPPFGTDMVSLSVAIVREEPPPLSRVRRDVPPDLEAAVRRALAKAPGARPGDTHGFAASLARFAPPEGRALMERIHDLTRSRSGDDDAMEISDVEDADEDTSDADNGSGTLIMNPDAAAKALQAAMGGSAASAPKKQPVTQEKTEMLGFSFSGLAADPRPPGASSQPMSPRPAAGSRPMQASPQFMGAAAAAIRGGAGPSSQPMMARQSAAPASSSPGFSSPSGPGSFGGGVDGGMSSARTTGSGPVPAGLHLPPSRPSDGAQHQSAQQQGATPSWSSSGPVASIQGTGAPVLMDSSHASGSGGGKRTALFAAIGGLGVLAVILLGVLVIPTGQTATSASGTASAPTGQAPVAAGATATATAGTAGGLAVNLTAEPVAANGDPATPVKKPVGGAGAGSRPEPTTKPTATATAATAATAATTATAAPPPPSGEMGTLVAVAVGGSCAFSVNGASKGSGSSIKIQVKAGPYTVSCKPTSGGSKSKSVTVSSGGTAMAMFKLQ